MDRNDFMKDAYYRLQSEDLDATYLWEVMNDMPDKQRHAFLC